MDLFDVFISIYNIYLKLNKKHQLENKIISLFYAYFEQMNFFIYKPDFCEGENLTRQFDYSILFHSF